MDSIHEDPPLEIFTLNLTVADLREHIASLEAELQAKNVMLSIAMANTFEFRNAAERLRARQHTLIDQVRELRQQLLAFGSRQAA